MQMNYGVQQLASVVTLTAGGCTYDVSLLVNKRKHFLVIVAIH